MAERSLRALLGDLHWKAALTVIDDDALFCPADFDVHLDARTVTLTATLRLSPPLTRTLHVDRRARAHVVNVKGQGGRRRGEVNGVFNLNVAVKINGGVKVNVKVDIRVSMSMPRQAGITRPVTT